MAEPPHNLPLHVPPLIGRESEVRKVRNLLDRADVRLVTLTGAGGTGKTRVGLRVAAELLDRFEHGVSFVDLAPISDPSLVVPTIAQTLGVPDHANRPLVELIADHLRARRYLLLLDNFEQVLDAALHVDALLRACPGLRVLVTSRAPLQLRAEHEFTVPPLALPVAQVGASAVALCRYGAVALFAERAAAVQPSFAVTDENGPDIAEICRRLDGLPLAIELAAAHVRALTPQAMLRRMGQRLPLLTGGPRDLPVRQQAMRSTIAWSHDLLTQSERRLFRRLAVFAGGWSLDAAEAVCDLDDSESDVLPGLESLVAKHLARRVDTTAGDARFGMLETIREYALAQLEASGEEIVIRRRHLQWCMHLAERTGLSSSGDQVAWLNAMSMELDNLRAGLTWGIADEASRDARVALRLATALWSLWFERDHLAEGRRWLEQALASDRPDVHGGDALPDPPDDVAPIPGPSHHEYGRLGPVTRLSHRSLRVAALNTLALLEFHQQGSDRRAREALGLAQQVGDPVGCAYALNVLGNYARTHGDYALAAAHHQQAVALLREAHDMSGVWRCLANLGEEVAILGDYERARRLLEECLALARALGGSWGVGHTLYLLGRTAYWQGDLGGATRLLEESMVWWRRADATRGPHWSLGLLGWVTLAKGQVQGATAHFLKSLDLCCEAEDRWGIARCLEGLASAAVDGAGAGAQHRALRAARLLGAAEALRQRTGVLMYPQERAACDRVVAEARARLDDVTFAMAWDEGRALPLERVVEDARATPVAPAEDRIEPTVTPPFAPTSPLSRREREVAVLIARGLSNRQIATELVIALRTVEAHVEHILGKLGCTSRTQVVAWAIGQGLLAEPTASPPAMG